MMGQQRGDQSRLFYAFNFDELIPERHFLRRVNPIGTRVLAELRSIPRPLITVRHEGLHTYRFLDTSAKTPIYRAPKPT